MRPARSVLIALAVLVATPATASAIDCARLPAKASLASGDPTGIKDQPVVAVTPVLGTPLRHVRVGLTRNGRTYATATAPTTIQRQRVVLDLKFARALTAGSYRLSVSGTKPGCKKRPKTSGRWLFSRATLPIRAALVSSRVADNPNGLRLVVRSVAGVATEDVTLTLLDLNGGRVATAALGNALVNGSTATTLPFNGPVLAGRYILKITGRAPGYVSTGVYEQQITLSDGGGTALPDPARQRLVVDWDQASPTGRDVAGFIVPGVGYGEITCRRDMQAVRIRPQDQGRELDILGATNRSWGRGSEDAILEGLHSKGTGPDAIVRFNHFGTSEKYGHGTFTGVIADRGAIGGPGNGPYAPPASIDVTWTWVFSPAGQETCRVDATVTPAPTGAGTLLNWSGAANAVGRSAAALTVPGIGDTTFTCDTTTRSALVTATAGTVVDIQEPTRHATQTLPGTFSVGFPMRGLVVTRFPGGARLLIASSWSGDACHVAAVAQGA